MTLVNIPCYCGRGFGLPNSKRKQILPDFDKFCDAECLKEYIKSLPVKNADPLKCEDVIECFLQDPLEYYCGFTGRHFRSSYEAIFARFCDYIKEPWDYEPCVILLKGRKQYNPDFFLRKRNLFVEVKGAWAGSNKSKMRTCVQKGHNLILVPAYLIRSIDVYNRRCGH